MFNGSELKFLCECFGKCRIQVSIHSPSDPISVIANDQLRSVVTSIVKNDLTLADFTGDLKEKTLYRTVNRFSLCYCYLTFEYEGVPSILLVGPYLSSPLSDEDILEIAEKNSIPPQSMKYVNEFYSGIPIILPNDSAFIFLNTFCEHLWDTNSFSVVDLNENFDTRIISAVTESDRHDDFDSTLLNVKLMEKRYMFENEMMEAVSNGQIHKETQLFSSISDNHFEKRVADPLRNAKNYAIIMNTLLRKAAESGGVHPIHLDRLSSSFASKIETLQIITEHYDLMLDMFRSYCRLVRKHTMKGLSPIVRKTVLMIESNVSSALTLSTLAEAQNISPGYLSTIFKKETDKTVSEYIWEKRLKRAEHLLSTTNLQIQTVALHCGVVDVQYFSKMFKKRTGITPKEYRESVKQK